MLTEKRQGAGMTTQWPCPSLLGLKGGSGCTCVPVTPEWSTGLPVASGTVDAGALQGAPSNSQRTLLWRVLTWFLYFANPFHMCVHACTRAHTESWGSFWKMGAEIIRACGLLQKHITQHNGKPRAPAGMYRRYGMLWRMSPSAGVIGFFNGDPNAFFQVQ